MEQVEKKRRRRPGGKQSANKVNQYYRKALALSMRKQGYYYTNIAERLGITEGRAYQMVTEEMNRLKNERHESAESMRILHLHQMDDMINTLWPEVIKGKTAAMDRILKIQERQAKLLGMDAPEKQQVEGNKDKPIEVVFRYEGDEDL